MCYSVCAGHTPRPTVFVERDPKAALTSKNKVIMCLLCMQSILSLYRRSERRTGSGCRRENINFR